MTPAQRALILAALGLTPRDGVMPRWSAVTRLGAEAGGVLGRCRREDLGR